MISSIAESFIQRVCGKYLKNFGPENIAIGVTGTITLSDIEIRTEEFNKFQLPYKPTKAVVEQIVLDLPFVLGGNFEASITGLYVVFSRDESGGPDLASDDCSFKIQSMIQNWIAFFYFSLLSTSQVSSYKRSKRSLSN
jgi:hypothetical protein